MLTYAGYINKYEEQLMDAGQEGTDCGDVLISALTWEQFVDACWREYDESQWGGVVDDKN